jgi:hypothetical protein
LERRSQGGISWQDYCKILRDLISSVGQVSSTVPKVRFIPPSAPYSAIVLLRKIVITAKINLKVIDPYADIDTAFLIENCDVGVNIQILSTQVSKNRKINSLILEAQAYKTQYGHIEVKLEMPPETQHDRFIIIDDSQVYDIGSSINHIGEKATTIYEIEDPQEKQKVIDNFDTVWKKALQKV